MGGLNQMRRALLSPAKKARTWPGLPTAAVAAIFRQHEELEVLMIRRAMHDKDPWSGHMAFPGGRMDPGDAHPRAAAERETLEEIGLPLPAHAQLLGPLNPVLAPARLRPPGLVIHPFVYELERPAELLLEVREVAEAIWIPWSLFTDPEARGSIRRPVAKVPLSFPCYRYGDRVIWGLTLRMIDELRGRFSGAATSDAC